MSAAGSPLAGPCSKSPATPKIAAEAPATFASKADCADRATSVAGRVVTQQKKFWSDLCPRGLL